MALARLVLFGFPRFEADGWCVDAFPTRRSLYLLARLALSEEGRLSRRELAALLWPGEPFDTTGPRLRQELARLRRALGPEAGRITSDSGSVALRLDDLDVDVRRFLAAVRAEESEPRGHPNLAESDRPFLQGAEDRWVVAERRRFDRIRGQLRPGATPTERRGLIGRDEELERIRRWLDPEEGPCRLATVLGPGGVGKTRLIREAVEDLAAAYSGHAAFVDLSEVDRVEAVPEAVMRALGHGNVPTGDPVARLEAGLPRIPYLLALDNLEPFGTRIRPLIARLLQARPKLRILAGSRTALGLSEEFRLPLAPLLVPAVGANRSEVFRSPAVRLLVASSEAAGVPAEEVGTDIGALIALVRRLEGMPLGIRLAAAHLRLSTVGELALWLSSPDHELTQEDEDVPERHRSLERALAGSFSFLSPSQRSALASLSVFRGGFTLAGAGEVAEIADPAAILGSLVDASLLERRTEGGQVRFRMLETVRNFSAAQLDREAEAVLRRRHLRWARQIARSMSGWPVEGQRFARFSEAEPEKENLHTALRFAIETDPDAAFALAGDLGPFWVHRSSGYEARELYRELFRRHGGGAESPVMLQAALGRSWIEHVLGFPGDPDGYRFGIELGRRLGDRSHEGTFLAILGLYGQNSMRYEVVEEVDRELDDLAASAGWGEAEGTVLRMRGQVALYRGEVAESIRLYHDAVAWARSHQDAFGLAAGRLHLATAAIEADDLDMAESTLGGLEAEIRRLGLDPLIPSVLYVQARVDVGRGRPELAIHRFAAARDFWDRNGLPFKGRDDDYNLGRVRFDQGRYGEALDRFLAAAEGWLAGGFPVAAAVALIGIAAAVSRLGHTQHAGRILRTATETFAAHPNRLVASLRRFEERVREEVVEDTRSISLDPEGAIALARCIVTDL